MLYTEFNLDDAMAVRYEEGREDGLEEGRVNEKLEIARNALVKGAAFEFVHEITGLDLDTLKDLQEGL